MTAAPASAAAVAGFDTATMATAVAVLSPDGAPVERRDDPGPGERPRHATRLLPLLEEALAAAGVDWEEVGRLVVGVGPGSFTGVRIGVATARALAQARRLELVGCSSLRALAAGAMEPDRSVLAVIDARRGEVFAAAWWGDTEVLAPAARRPEALAAEIAELGGGLLTVGDGAVRFRDRLVSAGADIPGDGDPRHRLSAVPLCRLGARARPAEEAPVLPDYRREPDAQPPRPAPPAP